MPHYDRILITRCCRPASWPACARAGAAGQDNPPGRARAGSAICRALMKRSGVRPRRHGGDDRRDQGLRRHRSHRRRTARNANGRRSSTWPAYAAPTTFTRVPGNTASKRVIYASSVHAIGYHEVECAYRRRCAGAPRQPLWRLQDLRGKPQQVVLGQVRHRDRLPAHLLVLPRTRPTWRMLWSYLSFADCVRLVVEASRPHRAARSVT